MTKILHLSLKEIYFFVRDFRSSLLPPVRPFAQLHAVWHTLAAVGSYYHVLFRLVIINLSPAGAFVEPNYRVFSQKEYNKRYWFPFRGEKISSHTSPTNKAGSWYRTCYGFVSKFINSLFMILLLTVKSWWTWVVEDLISALPRVHNSDLILLLCSPNFQRSL